MKRFLTSAVAVSATALLIAGCSASDPIGGQVIAPVTVTLTELQGSNIELKLNQALNINVPDGEEENFEAEVSNPEIIEFVQGTITDSMRTNPGFVAIKTGGSEVTLNPINASSNIESIEFSVRVTE